MIVSEVYKMLVALVVFGGCLSETRVKERKRHTDARVIENFMRPIRDMQNRFKRDIFTNEVCYDTLGMYNCMLDVIEYSGLVSYDFTYEDLEMQCRLMQQAWDCITPYVRDCLGSSVLAGYESTLASTIYLCEHIDIWYENYDCIAVAQTAQYLYECDSNIDHNYCGLIEGNIACVSNMLETRCTTDEAWALAHNVYVQAVKPKVELNQCQHVVLEEREISSGDNKDNGGNTVVGCVCVVLLLSAVSLLLT